MNPEKAIELNNQLRRIFEYISKNEPSKPEDLEEMDFQEAIFYTLNPILRRKNSKLRGVLRDNLAEILKNAKVTNFYKEVIANDFDYSYKSGLNNDETLDILNNLFDSNKPNSGGIFDPDRAYHIETQALNSTAKLFSNLTDPNSRRYLLFFMKRWNSEIKIKYNPSLNQNPTS